MNQFAINHSKRFPETEQCLLRQWRLVPLVAAVPILKCQQLFRLYDSLFFFFPLLQVFRHLLHSH